MNNQLYPQGIIVALITPFRSNQSINKEAIRLLVNLVISNGVHGIFTPSNQGEFYTLSCEEKERIISIVIEEVNGRVPVYIGTGAATTAESIAQGKRASELGGNALSVITPYIGKHNQRELLYHFKAIASETDLPVILYNNPRVTGTNLDTSTVVELSKIENIVGIKDSSSDLIQSMEYIYHCPDNFAVLAGHDSLILPTLMMGGQGAISSTANVVSYLLVQMYDAFIRGNMQEAIDIQYKIMPLRKAYSMGTFPIVIKEALDMIGIPAGPARSPVLPLEGKKRRVIRSILKNLGLIENAIDLVG